MTLAICLKCGTDKFGAWTPCRKCRHLPCDEDDKSKHLLVTDHFLSKDELKQISERIKKGEELSFDQQQVDEITHTAAQIPESSIPKAIIRLVITGLLLVSIGILVWTILR